MDDFDNRLAFVTGGASGIGLAIGQALAARGMKVALADIDDSALPAAVDTIAGSVGLSLDVRDRRSWTVALDRAERAFGPLAVLVSNAGVAGSRLPVAQTSSAAWEWSRSVNLDGTFHALSLGVPRLLRTGRPGHVFATASLGALLVVPGNGVYSATKAAVVALCEALRGELQETPVDVSVLLPGPVRTRLSEANGRRSPSGVAIGPDESGDADPTRDGIAPAAIGKLVVDALGTDRFWLFSHPELQDRVAARATDMQNAIA